MTADAVLVMNVGSTSLKYRVYAMPSETCCADGRYERIGTSQSGFRSHADAIDSAVDTVRASGVLDRIGVVGFKTVMARGYSGAVALTEDVLHGMQVVEPMFPQHNGPYLQAISRVRSHLPHVPAIGVFETAFFDDVPEENSRYAVPLEWERVFGVRRYGFHGASHRFIATRVRALTGRDDCRIISCHLGGSSSVAAIHGERAIDSSWGMSAQTGLPHTSRAGDFDVFAARYLADTVGLGWQAVFQQLGENSGLKGMAGTQTGDLRDIRRAAEAGSRDASIAIRAYAVAVRRYIGQAMVQLGGVDAITFSGGVGENDAEMRAAITANLDFLGVQLDEGANADARNRERNIAAVNSPVQVWVIPANEEVIVARAAWGAVRE